MEAAASVISLLQVTNEWEISGAAAAEILGEEERRKISLWRDLSSGRLVPPPSLAEHHLVTNLPRRESVLLPRVMTARLASSSKKLTYEAQLLCSGANLTCTSCMISWNVECVE